MTAQESRQPIALVISAVEGFVDEAIVRRYAELAGPAIEVFGGRFVVSNIEPVVVEGASPSRHVSIVEFPSMRHATAWYESPEYSEARAITADAFRGRVLMFVALSVQSDPWSRRPMDLMPCAATRSGTFSGVDEVRATPSANEEKSWIRSFRKT
jgi:uncharacterized protein (DUF1330 family)